MQNAGVEKDLCDGEDGHCSKGVCVVILHESKADGIDQINGEVPHEAHNNHIRQGYPKRPEEIRLSASNRKEVLLPEQENCKEALQEDLIRDIEEFFVISR